MTKTGDQNPNILIQVDDELRVPLDEAAAQSGKSRAHWVRLAIAEKLERLGVIIDPTHIHPRPRTGKGGRPTHKAKPLEGHQKIIHRGAAARIMALPKEVRDAMWHEEKKGQESQKKAPAKADARKDGTKRDSAKKSA